MIQIDPEDPLDIVARTPLQAVADVVARHYKEMFGRGPQRCRAHVVGRDAIVVVLEGTMTSAERRLAEIGEHERARSSRAALQSAVQGELLDAVRAVAGRIVVHGVGGIDVVHDVATELFVLGPEDELSAADPAG